MKHTDRPPRISRALRKQLLAVLRIAFEQGLSLQSEGARSNAQAVAAAASLQLITTRTSEGFGRRWRPTARGLTFYEENL